MDEIINSLFEKWNDDEKCGYCWNLVRTLDDHIKGTTNLYKPVTDDLCCVHAFLKGINYTNSKEVNNTFGYTEVQYCDYRLHFYIVKQGNFNASKADESGCKKSVYNDVITPLMNCLNCEFESDLCSVSDGETVVTLNETYKPIINFGDENWSGLDYYVTLRIYKN